MQNTGAAIYMQDRRRQNAVRNYHEFCLISGRCGAASRPQKMRNMSSYFRQIRELTKGNGKNREKAEGEKNLTGVITKKMRFRSI